MTSLTDETDVFDRLRGLRDLDLATVERVAADDADELIRLRQVSLGEERAARAGGHAFGQLRIARQLAAVVAAVQEVKPRVQNVADFQGDRVRVPGPVKRVDTP